VKSGAKTVAKNEQLKSTKTYKPLTTSDVDKAFSLMA
jgi:hypothetical protein